jgi:hypothetical protein
MIDWVEGHLRMTKLLKALYDAMVRGDTAEGVDLCEQIIIEARLTRTTIKGQRKEDV